LEWRGRQSNIALDASCRNMKGNESKSKKNSEYTRAGLTFMNIVLSMVLQGAVAMCTGQNNDTYRIGRYKKKYDEMGIIRTRTSKRLTVYAWPVFVQEGPTLGIMGGGS